MLTALPTQVVASLLHTFSKATLEVWNRLPQNVRKTSSMQRFWELCKIEGFFYVLLMACGEEAMLSFSCVSLNFSFCFIFNCCKLL